MKNNCKNTTLYIQQTYEKLGTDSEYFDKVVDAGVGYLEAHIKLSSKTPEEKFSRTKEKTDSEVNIVYGRKIKRDICPDIKNILKGVLTDKIKEHLNPNYVGPKFLLFDKVSHYSEANKNGYNTLFKPSVDRIDCEKDYVEGNIDIKTMYDNMGKGSKSESDFNEYNNFNKLNNNKMKNQNNTPNNNTIQLKPIQDDLVKYFVDSGSANYAANALYQFKTEQSTFNITTNPKQPIQTNQKKSSSQMAAERFNNHLKTKKLLELANTADYQNITVSDNKGNDFYKLKISSMGKFIVKNGIQLYKKGKSQYYISNKDYDDYSKFMNKSTETQQSA